MPITIYDLVGKDVSRPFSPHCWKSKMLFADLGLEYETVPTRFTEVTKIENGNVASLPAIREGELLLQDSFKIARHYASGKPQMGGAGGEPIIRFVESWSQSQLHSWIGQWAMLDVHNLLDEKDQTFFRAKREKLFGKTLEELTADRENSIPELVKRLLPIKFTLKHHQFIGGEQANFADYIVFGAFQWLRMASSLEMIPADHPVMDWFQRCMDLHAGLGHSVKAGKFTA